VRLSDRRPPFLRESAPISKPPCPRWLIAFFLRASSSAKVRSLISGRKDGVVAEAVRCPAGSVVIVPSHRHPRKDVRTAPIDVGQITVRNHARDGRPHRPSLASSLAHVRRIFALEGDPAYRALNTRLVHHAKGFHLQIRNHRRCTVSPCDPAQNVPFAGRSQRRCRRFRAGP
jgi:hypothetical protein